MAHYFKSDEHAVNTTNTILPVKSIKRKKKNRDYGIWFHEPFSPVRGESALWVAVITQAMMDALSRSNNAEALYHKHEAIRWLSDNSKDFVEVCLMAGLDPDYVRRKAKRTLIAPIRWRAEAGKGKRYLERKAYRQRQRHLVNRPTKQPLTVTTTTQLIVGAWTRR